MTPQQKQLVQDSFKKVAPIAPLAADLFYARLFELDPQLRLLSPVGGTLIFSGAQMHSSVPNSSGRTRYSIDFRTVHLGDALQRLGARKCDEECTGTTMRDYLRATDLARMPEEVIALYDDGTADSGKAIYEPGSARDGATRS